MLCREWDRCLRQSGPSTGSFFIWYFLHWEHQWSICMQLLPTGSCLSSHHHSQIHGPTTLIWCQLVLWSGMGMVYIFPPFKILPAVLNKICRSCNLTVIFVAPQLMSVSWMPELEWPSYPSTPLDGHPLLTPEVWLPGCHTKTRHYWPNLHAWLL